MPAVSVIIPVYGVEKYIERCARSLFEQSLEDIEYIFVNDCTPDASVDVLRRVLAEYPQRAGQVRIVDMEHNSGQAAVRRLGNSLVTGDYVIHCDSDDWVDPDMYRVMYEKAVAENLDVVICDYYLTDGTNHQYWGQHYKGDPIKGLLTNWLSASTCNKLVRRSILEREDFIFPTVNFCEDFVYNVQYFLYGPEIGYIDKALYYYLRHEASCCTARDTSAILRKFHQNKSNIDLALDILDYNGRTKKYFGEIISQKLAVKKSLLPVISRHYGLWRETYSEIHWKVMFCDAISFRDKILFLIAYTRMYPLYEWMVK